MNKLSLISSLALLIITLSTFSHAEVPKLINYQGHLTDKGGNPLTGTFSITFTIYDTETGTNDLWTETQSTLAVTNGLFNVLLGTATVGGVPESIFTGADRWLGVAIEGDSETVPRQQLVSVPYAYKAFDAETLNGQSGSFYNELISGGETDLHTHSSIGTLGTWVTRSQGIAYQAATDGFLVGYGVGQGSGDPWIQVKTDSSNPPITIRQKCGIGNNDMNPITTPVRNGDYYMVESVDCSTVSVYWIPLGN